MKISNLRHILFLLPIFIVFTACGQNKTTRVTVVFFDNQNPNSRVTVDTLLKAKELNLADTPMDLFFASNTFHLPYYVPTDGIYKNAAKVENPRKLTPIGQNKLTPIGHFKLTP